MHGSNTIISCVETSITEHSEVRLVSMGSYYTSNWPPLEQITKMVVIHAYMHM